MFRYTGFPFSRPARLVQWLSIGAIAGSLPACNAPSDTRSSPSAGPSLAATDDAATALVPTDAPPLPPSGNWKSEIEAFVSDEQCVHDLRVASPLLGEALLALGYETLAQDACGLLAAAKAHDPKRCGAILATSLRARCVTLVAATSADPELCPLLESRERSRGHDPTCLALASGREALCAGEGSPADERLCHALYTEDPARCQPLLAEPRGRCLRDVERWRGLLPKRAVGPAEAKTKGTLVVHSPGEDAGADVTAELREASRGVVLSQGLDKALGLGEHRYDAPTTFVPPPTSSARVGLTVTLTGKLQHLEVELPGRAVLVSPGMPFVGTVTVTELAAKDVDLQPSDLRGHPVQVTLNGTLGGYRLELHAETFVRDVVRGGSGAAPP